jgi:hypothetical protein
VNLLCEHALINAYVDHSRPVASSLVEEVAREFQLDQIEPTAQLEASAQGEKDGNTQKLLQNLDELLGRLRHVDFVPSPPRERKP